MIKVVFLILIVSVSLLYTTSVAAYTTEGRGSSNYAYSICVFSVIICLNDQVEQEQTEKYVDEKFIYSVLNQVNSTNLKNWIDEPIVVLYSAYQIIILKVFHIGSKMSFKWFVTARSIFTILLK